MSFLAISFVLLSVVIFAGVILAAPRLLLRPQLKERLRQLRDEAYDSRQYGEFPFGQGAIEAFIARVDAAIEISDELTPIRIISVLWIGRKLSEDDRKTIEAMHRPDLTGLNPGQIERYGKLDFRFHILVVALPLLGTWLGLLTLLVTGPILALIAGINVLSATAQRKTESVLSEQRIRVEGMAFELSQDSRPRRHLIGA